MKFSELCILSIDPAKDGMWVFANLHPIFLNEKDQAWKFFYILTNEHQTWKKPNYMLHMWRHTVPTSRNGWDIISFVFDSYEELKKGLELMDEVLFAVKDETRDFMRERLIRTQ